MPNIHQTRAKNTKNDEFYTQWADIEREVQSYLEYNPDVFRGKTIFFPCDDPEWSNFTKFFALHFTEYGIKKLISTSFAAESKVNKDSYQLTLFEMNDPKYDESKTRVKGKVFILENNKEAERIDIDDLKWDYMESDGDYRSAEVQKICAEADVIITNPPFSLFREFLGWIIDAKKAFLIIGNMNAIAYREVFPYIKENKLWLGATGNGSDMVFAVPKGTAVAVKDREKAARLGYVGDYTRLGNSCWFTNLDHGRRHQPLPLMTMADNLKFSRHREIKGKDGYQVYDNYDAIEVPFVDSIPSDYDGIMGVPISFLDKYCPEQFEIVDLLNRYTLLDTQGTNEMVRQKKSHTCNINGVSTYVRIAIRRKASE